MQKLKLSASAILFGLLLTLAQPGAPPGPVSAQPSRPTSITPTPSIPRPTLPPLPTDGPPRPTLPPLPTDGPPRPTFSPAPTGTLTEEILAPGSPADLCVRLQADPASAIAPGDLAQYQIVAQNRGPGRAHKLRLTVQYAVAEQSVLDVRFSDPAAWVRELQPGNVVIALASLSANDSLTATMRLRTRTDAQLNHRLNVWSSVSWDDGAGGDSQRSNRVTLLVANNRASDPPGLQISSPSPTIPHFTVRFDGFAANEQVSRWYHGPDGQATALEALRADADGSLVFQLLPSQLPPGRVMLVTYGQCSQVTAIGFLIGP